MSLTFPKPKLLQPKIPAVLVAGLMAAQYLFFGPGSSQEPKCSLIMDRPHISSNARKYSNPDVIKIKITSMCNVEQKFTELDVKLQAIDNNREFTAYSFGVLKAAPKGNIKNSVNFKNIVARCTKGEGMLYSGKAKGKVYLKNGHLYPVTGKSDKFTFVDCQMGAK